MKFGRLTEGSYEAEIHDILANDEHDVVIGVSRAKRKGKTLRGQIRRHHPHGWPRRGQGVRRFPEDQGGALEWLGGQPGTLYFSSFNTGGPRPLQERTPPEPRRGVGEKNPPPGA